MAPKFVLFNNLETPIPRSDGRMLFASGMADPEGGRPPGQPVPPALRRRGRGRGRGAANRAPIMRLVCASASVAGVARDG